MSRSSSERFDDILLAIARCQQYRPYLDDAASLTASMAYDAILRNLAVIGEAVRALPETTTSAMPAVPWPSIAGLRNVVVHEYFRVEPGLITSIVDDDLHALAVALQAARGESGEPTHPAGS